MNAIDKMASMGIDFFQKPFEKDIYGRIWNEDDRMDLLEYDTLSILSLLYVFANDHERGHILEGLDDYFSIYNPEEAIGFFLVTQVHTPEQVEKLFRRIDLNLGLMLGFRDSLAEQFENLADVVRTFQDCLVLSILCGGESLSLSPAVLIFSSYSACRKAQLRTLGISGPVEESLDWDSFDKLSGIFQSMKLEVADFMDFYRFPGKNVVQPVYDYFKSEIEKDALVSFTEKNSAPEVFAGYKVWDYAIVSGAMQRMEQYRKQLILWEYLQEKPKMLALKNAVGEIRDLEKSGEELFCEALQGMTGQKPEDAIEKMENDLQESLLNFFLYLSASDDFFSRKESDALREALDVRMEPQQMKNEVLQNNIYTVTFDQKVPAILETFVSLDKLLSMSTLDVPAEFARGYVDQMERVGRLFLEIDGGVNEDEERDFDTYMTTMRKYLDENSGK